MLHALEAQFSDTDTAYDEHGHKRWMLQTGGIARPPDADLRRIGGLRPIHRDPGKTAQGIEAAELRSLREKILALVPRSKIARIETDHEALLEAQGLAARPGPAAQLSPNRRHDFGHPEGLRAAADRLPLARVERTFRADH